MRFRHLPVTSDADTTADLEQIQAVLSGGLTAENLASSITQKLLGATGSAAKVERKPGELLEPSASKQCFVTVTLQSLEGKAATVELLVGGASVALLGNTGAIVVAGAGAILYSTMIYVPAGKKWEAKLIAGVEANMKLFSSYAFGN